MLNKKKTATTSSVDNKITINNHRINFKFTIFYTKQLEMSSKPGKRKFVSAQVWTKQTADPHFEIKPFRSQLTLIARFFFIRKFGFCP